MGPGIFDLKYCPNQLNVRLHLKFLNLNLSQFKEKDFPKSKRRSKCGVVVGVFGLGPKGRGLDSLRCVLKPSITLKIKGPVIK